jgi:glycerate kinase
LAARYRDEFGIDVGAIAGSGAAGGLSGGLWAAYKARLVPGAAYVLGLLGFDRRLEGAAAVVTGEGRLDDQSLEGKLVGEVAKRCREAGTPLHAIAGRVELSGADSARLGLASATEAGTLEAIEAAGRSLFAQFAE